MATAEAAITTAWTPPDPITGLSKSVVEEFAHIILNWDTSTLPEADFSHYAVYRRNVGAVEWTLIANVTSQMTPEWIDIYTGQFQEVEYKVTQFKLVSGDAPLESDDGDIVTASLVSDIWFVIGGESFLHDTTRSFELPVSSEKHTRPIQQEVFEPIVKSRKKVARGNTLGYEGSMVIRWLAEEREDAKAQLDYLTTTQGPHVLKSPFGDVWRVEFDAPDYTYLGGGHLTVEIGWVEIADDPSIGG